MKPPPIVAAEPPDGGELVFARRWPSRVERKQAMLDELADVLVGRGWVSDDDREWLLLCLDEVLVNAMIHGNEGDPDLDVDVAIHAAGGRWRLTVCDRGDGFRGEELPDPDDSSSLLLEHGRGIRIMREWLDDLSYYRSGACAALTRRCAT
ncbi:MAG: ATP-binding protein [Planctomycetes bacterium]|nr:ATP-binding protein [Planctomycetota bacterium]